MFDKTPKIVVSDLRGGKTVYSMNHYQHSHIKDPATKLYVPVIIRLEDHVKVEYDVSIV